MKYMSGPSIKWPADPERDKNESFNWCILTEGNWNEEAMLGWRFTASEHKKRNGASSRSRKRQKEC